MSLVISNKSLKDFPDSVIEIVMSYNGSTGDNSVFECWLRSELGHHFECVRAVCTNRSETLTNKYSRVPRTLNITDLSLTWMAIESQPPSLHDIILAGWPSNLRTLSLNNIILTPIDIRELIQTIPTLYKLTIDDVNITDYSPEESEIAFPLNSQFTILEFSAPSPNKGDIRTLLCRMLESSTNLNKIQFIVEGCDFVDVNDNLKDNEFITLLLKGYKPTAFHSIDACDLQNFHHPDVLSVVSKNISRILAVGQTTGMKLCVEVFDRINSVGFQSVKWLHLNMCNDNESYSGVSGNIDYRDYEYTMPSNTTIVFCRRVDVGR
jgi:hypothetical protein